MSYQLTLCLSKFIGLNLCDSYYIFSWFSISSPKLSSWSYYTVGHRRCPAQIIEHFRSFTGSCYLVVHTAHVHSRHTDLSQATNMSSRTIFFLSFTASSRFNTRNSPFNYPYISHFVSCFLSVSNTRRSSSKKRHEIPPWGSFIKDRIKWNYKRLNILKKGATEYETRRHSKAFMLIIKSHKTLCHDCNYPAFFCCCVWFL